MLLAPLFTELLGDGCWSCWVGASSTSRRYADGDSYGAELARVHTRPLSRYDAVHGFYRAVMNAKVFGGLPLARAYRNTSMNLASLGLGQFSVSHVLLHFGR